MHFCQDELMALLTAFPIVRGIAAWLKARSHSVLVALQLKMFNAARKASRKVGE